MPPLAVLSAGELIIIALVLVIGFLLVRRGGGS